MCVYMLQDSMLFTIKERIRSGIISTVIIAYAQLVTY